MTTTLDTIAMTRRIRDTLYEQTKDMLPAERLAFYHAQAQQLHHRLGVAVVPMGPERFERTGKAASPDAIQQDAL